MPDAYYSQPPDIVNIIVSPNTKAAIFCVLGALVIALALSVLNLK